MVKGDLALFGKVLQFDLQNAQTTFRDLVMADVRKFMRLLTDHQRAVYMFGTRKHFALSYYAYIQLTGVRENVFLASTENQGVADLLARVRPRDLLWLFDFRRYPRLSGKVAAYCKRAGAQMIPFTDSLLAPQVRLADVTFVVTTDGVAAFDSYAAGITLINALLAEYARLAETSLRTQYALHEKLMQHFEIFAPNGSALAGRPAGSRRKAMRGNAPLGRLAPGGSR